MKISNKKAYFNYQVIDTWITGIILVGSEIKSIRDNKVNFVDSFAHIQNNEVFIKGLYISEYKQANQFNHIPDRERKLLLKTKEINKIKRLLIDKGMTLVPLSLFINEKGLCKVELGLCKGKKDYDKREDIKKKDQARDQDRDI